VCRVECVFGNAVLIMSGRFMPIELAAAAGHVDVVRWLATHGAPHGRAMAFAAACGAFGVVSAMISCG
jgi:hypothetical protein